jgi:hypothetical protein
MSELRMSRLMILPDWKVWIRKLCVRWRFRQLANIPQSWNLAYFGSGPYWPCDFSNYHHQPAIRESSHDPGDWCDHEQ